MAQSTTHHHLLCLFPLLLLLLLLVLQATTATQTIKGFTFDLIHRYSTHSPYYNSNLTESQLSQKLLEQSRTHAQRLESTLAANITTIRPPLVSRQSIYLVSVSIGTGDGKKSYFLYLDTGSFLTWIQCHPCDRSFNQPSPLFDPDKSPTYRRLRHNHRLCTHPYGRSDGHGNCAYTVRYAEGTTSRGVLSEDTFTFQSHQRDHTELVPLLVFGCARSTTVDPQFVGEWDGILAMGNTPISIPGQMDGRFSYCLVKPGSPNSGYLQIGGHMLPMSRTQAMAIQMYDGIPMYYLNLIDISVGRRRLHLPQGTFARHNHRSGGCFIDTGTTYTTLIKQAYDAVKGELVGYFTSLQLHPVDGEEPFNVCYVTPDHWENVLPQMTLHFHGADYVLEAEKLVKFNDNHSVFCWAMQYSDHITILGAFQQHSVRWSYDIELGILSFAPENCG